MTQGEWTITGVAGNGYFIHDANGNHIATGETLDAARLIAAAPKLLEALEELLAAKDAYEKNGYRNIERYEAAQENAKAAIAAAKV